MVGRFNLRSRKFFGLPMDLFLPSLIGILTLSMVVGGNILIEHERVTNPDRIEPPPPPVDEWTYDEQELISLQGWTDEASTSDQSLGLLPANTTVIRIVLTWQDDVGSNDMLRLSIALNGTELDSAEGTTGTLELEVSQNETISGDLTVSITAVSCPGRVGISPIDLDNGNNWDLAVHVTIRTKV